MPRTPFPVPPVRLVRMEKHVAQPVLTVAQEPVASILCSSPTTQLYANPLLPYTRVPLSVAPIANPRFRRKRLIPPSAPRPINSPSGNRFRTRCPFATPLCAEQVPPLREIEPHHFAACHYAEQLAGSR
ncbi:MAG: oligopeptide transport system ATP-binding protein [Thermomicrobiales bacterium]|jgi:oligopeptide/dipeptide ABC transporter ATP-binding protein|nr:oligopeptide transport system ATP-binding protein [Thermomicrobiales bacterium]